MYSSNYCSWVVSPNPSCMGDPADRSLDFNRTVKNSENCLQPSEKMADQVCTFNSYTLILRGYN